MKRVIACAFAALFAGMVGAQQAPFSAHPAPLQRAKRVPNIVRETTVMPNTLKAESRRG